MKTIETPRSRTIRKNRLAVSAWRAITGLALGWILVQAFVHADIIPSDRKVDWASYPPGVKGGIPTNRVIFCDVTTNAPGGTNALGNGLNDDYPVIQNAINRCPSNQVIYVPEGRFLMSRGLVLKSSITLRGAGPKKTILVFRNTGPDLGESLIRAYSSDAINGYPANSNTIVSGVERYATNVVVETTKGLVGGSFALIDQANDTNMVGPSVEAGLTYLGRCGGSRVMGQLVEILSVNGSNVTFTPPLAYAYTNFPQITPLGTYYRYIGIEDLAVSNALPAEAEYGTNIRFGQVVDSWIKNVSSWQCVVYHIHLAGCLRCVVRDSDVNTAYRYVPSHAYGIDLLDFSTACLVENNYSWMCGPGFAQEGAGPWNVYAYNYAAYARNDRHGMMWAFSVNHGAFPHMTLWEGNVGNGMAIDLFHAGSGFQTLFRNACKGWEPNASPPGSNTDDYQRAINLCGGNYYYNIVGNILGAPGLINARWDNEWTLEATTNNSSNGRPYIWRIGLMGTGESRDPANYIARTSETLLRHGNYDYSSTSTVWSSAISDHVLPNSYYLTNKPGWFGDLRWPPIGPDQVPMVSKLPAQVRFEMSGLTITNPFPFPSLPQGTIVVDNSTVCEKEGAWTYSLSCDGYWGYSYLHDGNSSKGTCSVTFRPVFPSNGEYEVSMWYPPQTASHPWASNVPVDIACAGEVRTVIVDQTTNGGQWVSLGIGSFLAGTNSYVRVRTTGTTGYVIADAVRWAPIVAPRSAPPNQLRQQPKGQ